MWYLSGIFSVRELGYKEVLRKEPQTWFKEIKMQFLYSFLLLGSSLHFILAAPKDKFHLSFEQAMLNKLHKPLYTIDIPPEHPRKGEYKCKGGVCKTKAPCEDCQGPVPLDRNWEYLRHWG